MSPPSPAFSTAAARRYAKALFGIAKDDGTVGATGRELAALADLLDENQDLRRALFRPLHPVAERRAALRAVAQRLGSSAILQNFCAFLIDQRRLVDFAAASSSGWPPRPRAERMPASARPIRSTTPRASVW